MNMSYCIFRNTLKDLRNCLNHIDDEIIDEEERVARQKLIELCAKIAEKFQIDC